MTSRGDQKEKLNYAFEIYDADNSGSLNKAELVAVIYGMLDMLGADRKGYKSEDLARECMHSLDKSGDGLISKDEFVTGLMENYSLRALMSPFN
jgi:serine/threonine-protein phosphatase 2B regulatory subunit